MRQDGWLVCVSRVSDTPDQFWYSSYDVAHAWQQFAEYKLGMCAWIEPYYY